MIKVRFTKLVEYEAELPDNFMVDNGTFCEDGLISYCENTDDNDENVWIRNDEVQFIEYEREGKKKSISKEEYDSFVKEREKSERCYEAGKSKLIAGYCIKLEADGSLVHL